VYRLEYLSYNLANLKLLALFAFLAFFVDGICSRIRH